MSNFKIGLLGDLHLRASKPINRIDDYYSRQFEKLKQAYDIFEDLGCSFVIQPGDFFNNYGNDPYSIVYDAVAFLILYRIPTYVVFGQHDIRFHNKDLKDIPIQILNQTDLITKLEVTPKKIQISKDQWIYLYGVNWNESIPSVEKEKNVTKILVIHSMIIKGRKLWPGQTNFLQARHLANKNFDLVISGDNHQAFSYKDTVINCGSLMRMNIDQKEHQPMFGVYDLEEGLTLYDYDIELAEQVLKIKEAETQKINEQRKKEFSESLSSDFEGELDYRANIDNVIANKKRIRKRTKTIIEDAVGGLNE